MIWVVVKISWVLDKRYFFLKWILSHMCGSFQHAAVGKMWNLATIEKSNEAQISMAGRWLGEAHLHQISWSLELYIGSYGLFFKVYRICQKSDSFLDWSKVTLIERSSSWNHGYSKLGNLSLVLRWAWSMKVMSIRSLDCGVHLAHICIQV
jgi:hypothetical protein